MTAWDDASIDRGDYWQEEFDQLLVKYKALEEELARQEAIVKQARDSSDYYKESAEYWKEKFDDLQTENYVWQTSSESFEDELEKRNLMLLEIVNALADANLKIEGGKVYDAK